MYNALEKNIKALFLSPAILTKPEPESDEQLRYLDMLKDAHAELDFDESTLKLESYLSAFEDGVHTVKRGTLVDIAFAPKGAVIEIQEGAKLKLFMANDGVEIVLKGDHSFAKIDRVTRNCNSIRILGKNGEVLSGGPNLELGEDVLEKLNV